MADIFHSGPAALILTLFEELKIGQTIDEMVRWDQAQCHMSPGMRVKALIINIFGRREKRPLYRIDETYEHMNIENLFGRGSRLRRLNRLQLSMDPWTSWPEEVRTKSSPRFAYEPFVTSRFH